MDIGKYEVIIKAAECGSLTRAGDSFGYTQSAVSHMLRGVEEEFGFRVFLRTPRGVTLTPDGERIIPILREIVRQNDLLAQTVGDICGLVCGKLRIGTFASTAVHWIPKIVKCFRRDFPGVEIDIIEGGITALERSLMEGSADLTFMSVLQDHAYESLTLCRDPLFAVLPPDDPLARLNSFPIEEFNERESIMIANDADYDADRLLKKYALTPRIKFSPHEDHTVYSMVENGLGISILPNLVLRGFTGNVVVMPLAPNMYRDLAVCAPSFDTLSPAAQRFVEYAKKMVLPDGSIQEI